MFFSSDYEFQLQQLLPASEEQPTTALDQTRSENSTLPAGDDDEENPQATVVRNGEHKKTPGKRVTLRFWFFLLGVIEGGVIDRGVACAAGESTCLTNDHMVSSIFPRFDLAQWKGSDFE